MKRRTLHASTAALLGGALHNCAKNSTAILVAGVLSIATVAAPQAAAQQVHQEQGKLQEFDVPESALSAALLRFGQQSGLQFNVDSKLTDGKRSAGVRGRYSVESGLTQLLAASGLTFRFAGPRSVVIETLPDVGDAQLLGPLRIEGAGGGAAVNGVNGSTDVTATEGTGSYTSGALGIASKTALSIKDTPQSVSVVTQQRMIEQNITDFTSLMTQASGVTTTVGSNGPLQSEFYSRGFRIQRLQLDGGAPLDIQNTTWGLVPQLDMAIYDHAEILRGVDGQFNGYGDPGGVISLTRKRPLDHLQVIVEGQAGSWDNYRTMVDVTGPLGLAGRLRGRGVAVWQDQDYFYDVASNRKTLLYGVLEYDLTSSTIVSAGASRSWQDAVPFTTGLPRYYSGTDLGLSRDTCLCFPYNRYDFDTTEFFGRVDQDLGEFWHIKANFSQTHQERSWKYGVVSGTVNPVTLRGPILSQTNGDGASKQTNGDLTLDGSFELFGHRQKLVIGGNYAQADGGGMTTYSASLAGGVAVDVLNFDPYNAAYYERTTGAKSLYYPKNLKTQTAAYATLGLTFWEPLHLNIGVRYNRYQRESESWTYCVIATGCTNRTTGQKYVLGERRNILTSGYDTEDSSWPPSFSVVYDVSKVLSAYASYSDIYQEQSVSVDASGQSLGPITGSNIETGIKWAGRDGRLNASLALYRIVQDNVGAYVGPSADFVSDGVHACCYSSDTDLRRISRGVDLEVTGEVLPGWQLASSYTLNDNVEEGSDSYQEGNPLQSRFPKHLIKLWSSYRFQQGGWLGNLQLGAGLNAQSRGYYKGTACLGFDNATGTCNGGTANFDFSQGFYAVYAARADYRLSDHWSVALNINNLFDRRYYQTIGNTLGGNWYGDPRNFVLTVRGQF